MPEIMEHVIFWESLKRIKNKNNNSNIIINNNNTSNTNNNTSNTDTDQLCPSAKGCPRYQEEVKKEQNLCLTINVLETVNIIDMINLTMYLVKSLLLLC